MHPFSGLSLRAVKALPLYETWNAPDSPLQDVLKEMLLDVKQLAWNCRVTDDICVHYSIHSFTDRYCATNNELLLLLVAARLKGNDDKHTHISRPYINSYNNTVLVFRQTLLVW